MGFPVWFFGYDDTTTASEGDLLDYRVVSKLPHITSKANYLSQYTFTDALSTGVNYNKDFKIAFDVICGNLDTTR